MTGSSADRERLEAVFRGSIRATCGVPRDTPVVDLRKQLIVRGLLDYWLLKVGTRTYSVFSATLLTANLGFHVEQSIEPVEH